jgi:hypothetical protein
MTTPALCHHKFYFWFPQTDFETRNGCPSIRWEKEKVRWERIQWKVSSVANWDSFLLGTHQENMENKPWICASMIPFLLFILSPEHSGIQGCSDHRLDCKETESVALETRCLWYTKRVIYFIGKLHFRSRDSEIEFLQGLPQVSFCWGEFAI